MLGFVVIFFLTSLLIPQVASAHAFGHLYNLPVPFWMYLYGSSAAVIFSFIIIGLFINEHTASLMNKRFFFGYTSFIYATWFHFLVKIVSIGIFLLIIIGGFLGRDESANNIAMTLFWIVFVLGITYIIGIFGNMWNVINPVKILFDFFGSLFDKGLFIYPQKLGYYPALLFYFIFIWIELYGNTTPVTLSIFLLLYIFIQGIGIVFFGKNDWIQHGEFFTVFFNLLGKMGILEGKKKKMYFRFPWSGLLEETAKHTSLVFFILFMLSSTAFDGLSGTTLWEQLRMPLYILLSPLFGMTSMLFINTIGLLLSPVLFLLLYIGLVWATKYITKTKISLKNLVLAFSFSLLPIAFAYNIAHYFTLLITEGQNLYRLVSDPFGYGWNVFGTRGSFDIYIPDVNIIWHAQVGIILLGHIVGVYIAHLIALKVFTNHKQAVISQIPMLFLMVIYTMIGLWILSQPITAEM